MKSIPQLAIGLFGSLLFAPALLAGGINFGPALGTYPAHYSHSKNMWWSDYSQGWEGPYLFAQAIIRSDVKFTGQPYARPASPAIDLTTASSAASPEFSQAFFRPVL